MALTGLIVTANDARAQAIQVVTARAKVAEPAPGAAVVGRALVASGPGRLTRIDQGLVSVRVVRPRGVGGRSAFVTVHFLRN